MMLYLVPNKEYITLVKYQAGKDIILHMLQMSMQVSFIFYFGFTL